MNNKQWFYSLQSAGPLGDSCCCFSFYETSRTDDNIFCGFTTKCPFLYCCNETINKDRTHFLFSFIDGEKKPDSAVASDQKISDTSVTHTHAHTQNLQQKTTTDHWFLCDSEPLCSPLTYYLTASPWLHIYFHSNNHRQRRMLIASSYSHIL